MAQPRKPNPKTDFVLGQPLEMKAQAVSAKAKEAGLEISTGYVYQIRSSAKKQAGEGKAEVAQAKASRAATESKRAKKTPKAQAAKAVKKVKPGQSKATFILAQPADMKPREVVEKAKAAGLIFSREYVHKVRTMARKTAKGAATVKTKKSASKRPAAKRSAAKTAAPSKKTPAKKTRAAAKKPLSVKPATKTAAKKPVALSRDAKAASPEVLFRGLVLELGMKRSRELLDEVQRKLADLIAGE